MTEITIPRRGSPRGIYHPETVELLASLGETQTRRAAHVDPTESLTTEALHWLCNERGLRDVHLDPEAWWADLTPVDGPVLGPFNLRDTALQAELTWLREHGLPFPLTMLEKVEERLQLDQRGSMPTCGGPIRRPPPTKR